MTIKHRMSKSSGAYKVWLKMRKRCQNPTAPHYDRYGGRGITVCERWQTFENFFADMGERPEGLTIERIDNNGNYELGNCKWATHQEQCNNRESNVLITAHGKTLNVAQWAVIIGKHVSTVHRRLRQGLTGEQAVATGYIKTERYYDERRRRYGQT